MIAESFKEEQKFTYEIEPQEMSLPKKEFIKEVKITLRPQNN